MDIDVKRQRLLVSNGGRLQVTSLRGRRVRSLASLSYIDEATWSPDGNLVALTNEGDSSHPEPCGTAIWIARSDGRASWRLSGCARSPSWARDSRRVAFVSITADASAGAVTLQNVDGSARRAVAPVRGTQYAPPVVRWAPRGGLLAYTTGQPDEIRAVPAGGGSRVFATRGYAPLWAPDGERLLFFRVGRRGVAGMYLATIARRRVRRLDGAGQPPAAWSPSGRTIAYVSGSRRHGAQVSVIRPDGSRKRTLTHERNGSHYWTLTWSRSGARILFVRELPSPE